MQLQESDLRSSGSSESLRSVELESKWDQDEKQSSAITRFWASGVHIQRPARKPFKEYIRLLWYL
jgi:hypothetical protein